MKLGTFTVGYIVSVTIAAAIGFLALKWIGARFPKIPVIPAVARSV